MAITNSEYTKTFTSFGGADIIATLGGKVVGELQAITYSVTREKAPIYTLGSANPRSFSRGKRGIAGSLVFTVFDRDALHTLKNDANVYHHGLSGVSTTGALNPLPVNAYDVDPTADIAQWATPVKPRYSDEIQPFDITVNFLNEYGQSASMTIYGVEILNEGMGLSIDDITTEKACTFIAREIDDMVSSTPNR
jgi:hypothetical protein